MDAIRARAAEELESAVAVLERAHELLGVAHLEPEAAREPLRLMLAAAIERCRRHHSLLGLEVTWQLRFADAVCAYADEQLGAPGDGPW